MWMLMLALSAQAGRLDGCEVLRFRDVVDVEAPAVLVLGERHGHQPDLRRAMRVVAHLAKRDRVTVALEAVHHERQPVLDKFAAGRLEVSDLPGLLDWDDMWGFRWRPYENLVSAAVIEVDVVAAGLTLGPKPEDETVTVPPRYLDVLRPAMGGHEVPADMEQRFVESMTWRDTGIARAAAEGWNGQGYLVVVTGRGHVEGGKGVNWQLQRRVSAPVHSVVLAPGGEPPCWDGDRVWR